MLPQGREGFNASMALFTLQRQQKSSLLVTSVIVTRALRFE
jgi:hypothetical protein